MFGKHAKYWFGVHQAGSICSAKIGTMTAPLVRGGGLGESRPQGIVMDVLEQYKEIAISIAEDGFISPLE